MKAFQLFVGIESIATRQAGDLKLTLSTQELSGEAAATLFSLRGKQLWAAFLDTEIQVSDLQPPTEEPEFPRSKSPSERLRNVIYVLWQQKGKPGEFEAFRAGRMEQIIEAIKGELEP